MRTYTPSPGHRPAGLPMSDPAAVVSESESRLRPLSIAANEAWWAANVEANGANEARRVEATLALSDLLADPELYAAIEHARAEGGDDQTNRQLELLHRATLVEQVPEAIRHRIVELEASVESRFARHRGVVAGAEVDDNEIKRILRESDDTATRREAWEASKTVGAAVADDVRQLARLRNEAARSLGYRDWFALSVASSEMSEDKLFETLDECDAVTAEPFASWKTALDARLADRFGCGVAELRPWHYADPFFQEVPKDGGVDLDPVFADADVVELAGRTFAGMGLETEQIVSSSDLFPRDGKCQHAFCMDVDRKGDVRVLANVVHDRYWADTMLHELGHGVFDLGFDDGLPWLLRDCHLTVTEGIAIMMGRLSQDGDWLREVAGVKPKEAERLRGQLGAAQAAELVVFTRWVLVMTSFERSLYAEPESNLDARWWELVQRYQGVTPPDGRKEPDWAAKIHVACAPVYYHTYLYGQLVASQLRATLDRETGGIVGKPEAGALLRERVFGPGQSLRWDRLIERATGEPLTARHMAAQITLLA